jgi:hypothetical protein
MATAMLIASVTLLALMACAVMLLARVNTARPGPPSVLFFAEESAQQLRAGGRR